jgi:hypothetical protein
MTYLEPQIQKWPKEIQIQAKTTTVNIILTAHFEDHNFQPKFP